MMNFKLPIVSLYYLSDTFREMTIKGGIKIFPEVFDICYLYIKREFDVVNNEIRGYIIGSFSNLNMKDIFFDRLVGKFPKGTIGALSSLERLKIAESILEEL